MSLSGADERVGVPRALLGRDGIGAIDRADALRRATRPNRAGGYTYAYAFRGGDAFMLEVRQRGKAVWTARRATTCLTPPWPRSRRALGWQSLSAGARRARY